MPNVDQVELDRLCRALAAAAANWLMFHQPEALPTAEQELRAIKVVLNELNAEIQKASVEA